ncbi:MAG TPA: type II toxin-antitoxin system VapC family toxin [Caulobacteraceae bacterium]
MRYLLDTNILSDLVRNPQGTVASRIAEVGEGNVFTSVIVAAELRYGVAKKGSERLATQVEHILAGLEILLFEEPSDAAYALLRMQLETAGTPIGGNDMLIAAHAIALAAAVVTNNEREFSRVGGLTVVNWLR